LTILSLKLQETGYIEVRGEQITPKPFINMSKNCIILSGKFNRTRTGNYCTNIISV